MKFLYLGEKRGPARREVMTVRHCVLGQFTDEATSEQKTAMFEAVRGLPAAIPEIQAMYVGPDMGLAEGNHGFALTVDFADADGYKVYATHEAHVHVISNNIKPILKPGSRTAVQFTMSGSKRERE